MARSAKASRSASVATRADVASTKGANSSGPRRPTAVGVPPAQSVLRRALDAPERLKVADLEVLQRSIGNRATERLLSQRSAAGPRTTNELAALQRRPATSTVTSGIVQRNGSNIHTLDDLKKKEGRTRLTLRLRAGSEVGDDTKPEAPTTTQQSTPTTSAFSGEGRRLSEWSFESDEERESERRAALATAQARYSAGLAPFEGEMDVSRIPWAPSEQRPSSQTRMSSVLENSIRSRRPFSSGATESDVDPLGHIQENLIPSSPFHGLIKSEVHKGRKFASGASDEYVELKSARGAYQQEVKSTIRNRRREQPSSVGMLERLWKWTNADIGDTTEETQHRYRQLPQVENLLITIEKTHNELEIKKREAQQKYIQKLLSDIAGLSDQVALRLKDHYDLLNSNDTWRRKYDAATNYFDILSRDPASQTEENLEGLLKTWRSIHGAAEKEVTSATSSSITALKIGFDPYDSGDNTTIYGYYMQTGGLAPLGQVQTVCQKSDKYGGTYMYKGKSYDMYHDSHGPSEGNSSLSRTAWKILINGKLQVVGIGHHIKGAAKYEAIFPYSTKPSVQEYGASPNITDSRT